MKRIWAVLLCLVILLVLSACQPTPEKATVVQKDSERLIEQAQKDASESNNVTGDTTGESDVESQDNSTRISIAEQYGVPDCYQFGDEGANGILRIDVDAQVIAPDQDAMPIYRVKAGEFSQETVSAFFNTLCGDTQMYINSGQRTKDQILEQIISIKKRIEDIKDNPEMAEELEFAKEFLPKVEQEYENAPETVVEERADGTLVEMTKTLRNSSVVVEGDGQIDEESKQSTTKTVTYMGLNACERDPNGLNGMGKLFSAQNDENPSISYFDYLNSAAGINFGMSSSIPIIDDTDIDEATLEEVGLAPSEVKHMVQELLDKTNSNMMVDSIYLQDDEQDGTYDDEVRPAERYAYKIYCVRKVDEYPCSFVMGGSVPDANDMMAPYWMYEELYFMVNSEGIFQMIWHCPIEVIETVNEDAQLKPFSQIQEIFEKMMRIKYETQAENGKEGDEMNFDINRVILSLHRIIEQDSNETGLLVPAWNFYGKMTNVHSYGQYESLGKSFLTINAIDGSVIDTNKGY